MMTGPRLESRFATIPTPPGQIPIILFLIKTVVHSVNYANHLLFLPGHTKVAYIVASP